jgi:hypothetical protein
VTEEDTAMTQLVPTGNVQEKLFMLAQNWCLVAVVLTTTDGLQTTPAVFGEASNCSSPLHKVVIIARRKEV